MLPAGRVALFAGKGGKGKSRLSLQLAAGIAANGVADWLPGEGRSPGAEHVASEGRPVVIASWEDEREEVHRRLLNIGEDRARLATPNLHFHDFAGKGALWEPDASIDGSSHTSTKGGPTDASDWLRAYCTEVNAKLLLLDPLAACFACNENDRGLVRAFVSDWDAWARDNDCAVIFIAHPPKSDSVWSGSTDWHSAVRAVWTLGRKCINPVDENMKRTKPEAAEVCPSPRRL